MPELMLVMVGAVLVLSGQPLGWAIVGGAIGSLIWEVTRS